MVFWSYKIEMVEAKPMNAINHREVLTELLGTEMSPLISGCVDRYLRNGNGKDNSTVMMQSVMDAINAVAIGYERDTHRICAEQYMAMMRCLKLAYMGARVVSHRRGAVG